MRPFRNEALEVSLARHAIQTAAARDEMIEVQQSGLDLRQYDEKLAGVEVISRALRPFWPDLWRLAARGHYAMTQRPVRSPERDREPAAHPAIPSVTHQGYTLSSAVGPGGELSMLLALPGPYAPFYPINGYPMLTEFRAMLGALAGGERRWHGRQFLANVGSGDGPATVTFRAHVNGITFAFPHEAWMSVAALFDRAFALPDVRGAWDALADEYGEL